MKLALIVAAAENDVIGQANTLPWRLSADLKRFKALTLGKAVIMGRKTFDSIGKPLPGRTNIVITRQPGLRIAGCLIATSLQDALTQAQTALPDCAEVMVIGGAEIYRQALPLAQRVYLTRVHATVPGDAFFPALPTDAWRLLEEERHAADEQHAHAFSFQVLERIS